MATIPRAPVEILQLLLEHASWFCSALELEGYKVDGEELHDEAEASVKAFKDKFQPGVAYMPVPRCKTCAHWDNIGSSNPHHGRCRLGEHNAFSLADISETTHANFGCVQWEAKAQP